MAIRGQRFHIDLDSDEETDSPKPSSSAFTGGFPNGLVENVKERFPSDDKIPSPPRIKGSETGFPAHRRRPKPSTFKQSREVKSQDKGHSAQGTTRDRDLTRNRPPPSSNGIGSAAAALETVSPIAVDERQKIDEENQQRLATMTSDEIEEARQGLLSGLSPSLIERLLKKANIDEGRTDSRSELEAPKLEEPLPPSFETPSSKKVTFEEPDSTATASSSHTNTKLPISDPENAPAVPPPDLQPASLPLAPQFHFPQPPPPPDLDPSDPEFLTNLHSTYFPSLPSNPSALSWMAPISQDESSTYSPSQSSLPPSSLRFDFRGHLLPPRLAAQLPSTLGLHHHASAPEAAGYTVPELAHLARSAFPAQRCIAYQTLGRVLYRLGRGDFGNEEDDLAEGLWKLMDQGRVVEGMVEEAGRGGESGNRSCWVTATEAVWLWRKGGGRRWKAK